MGGTVGEITKLLSRKLYDKEPPATRGILRGSQQKVRRPSSAHVAVPLLAPPVRAIESASGGA